MGDDFTVGVFISGRGSNLRSLLEQAQSYRVVAVFSDNPAAAGLGFAKEHGIPGIVRDPANFSKRSDLTKALFSDARERGLNLIALAGFMQVVPRRVIDEWRGKIINIHPSLLPAYPGLHTHDRVIASSDTTHGCTVHVVDAGVDTGPRIVQASCVRHPTDSAEELAQRVLELEHRIYPWVVNQIARGMISINNETVTIAEDASSEARKMNFHLPGV